MAISVSVKMSEQEILGGSVEPLEPLWLWACSLSSCVPISHLFHNAKSAYLQLPVQTATQSQEYLCPSSANNARIHQCFSV